jgi:hypothetical protein
MPLWELDDGQRTLQTGANNATICAYEQSFNAGCR